MDSGLPVLTIDVIYGSAIASIQNRQTDLIHASLIDIKCAGVATIVLGVILPLCFELFYKFTVNPMNLFRFDDIRIH